jgi:pSer/pThr/pTyr-binding forkhead associated (FHA) protein
LTLTIVGAVVGAAIGAGLNVVAGMSNLRLKNLIMRVPVGLVGGGIGGAVGIVAGQMIYTIGLPRALGFMLLGLGVGVVEGVYERSPSKIRNGLMGGLVGGLVGGFLFDPISALLASGSGIASRAAAFVILGICIGAMVGFVQVVLKEASLRVLDGFGVGRELILSDPVTVLGRSDHLRLPFLGPTNADLDPEHLRIVRQPGGVFTIEDNDSKLGVSVRGEGASSYDSVSQPRTLHDGDVIRFGPNLVRFSQRKKKAQAEEGAPQPVAATPSPRPKPAAPPPPPPKRKKPPSEAGQPTATTQAPSPAPKRAAPKSPPPAPAPKPVESTKPGAGPKGPPPPPPRKKKP